MPPGTHSGLSTLEVARRAENLAIAGPSGDGRSRFVEALAHKVTHAGMRVSWFTLESLTATVGRASVDGSNAKTVARITRAELIVIDDIGLIPAGQAALGLLPGSPRSPQADPSRPGDEPQPRTCG